MEIDTRKWMGLRREDLGANPCWKLIHGVYLDAGEEMPDYEQYVEHISGYHGKLFASQDYFEEVKDPQPGDVIVLWMLKSGTADHVGLYIGEGKFLHISKGKGVTVQKAYSPIWKRRVIGYWRWKGVASLSSLQ